MSSTFDHDLYRQALEDAELSQYLDREIEYGKSEWERGYVDGARQTARLAAARQPDATPAVDEAPSDDELALLFWEAYSGKKRITPLTTPWSRAGVAAVREALAAQAKGGAK